MPTTVDKRVVSMEFQNERFERNLKQTIDSLDKLEEKLKFEHAKKDLKNFSDSINEMDFSKVAAGIEGLEKRFSTMGVVGMSVINNLTTSAMHALSGITGKIKNMIYTGGLSRAMNIEKAKFQLEGLGVTWKEVFGDIDYAVTNTAYALDSAAVAASQLVASGVQIGNDITPALREMGYTGEIGAEGLDEMAVSLKAISGVAAQTSSDYDSIAHIFTTVAGQGRLMTMQLRQLEMRGLNVAAKLGEVLGASEAEIREAVTKGLIDYNTFATAMFTLFADHAAEANKTLTGVSANIKSAFSRIGAEFINPIIQNEGPLVNLLEEIRKRINFIKKALTDWKRGGMLDDKVVGDTTSFLERITDLIKRFPLDKVLVVANCIGKIYDGISQFAKNMRPLANAIKEDYAEIFPDTTTLRDIWLFGERVKEVLSNFKYIYEYADGFEEITDENGNILLIEKSVTELNPRLEKLRRTLKGLFAVVSIIKQAFEMVLRPIKTLISLFFKGDSLVLTATASLGDFLVFLDEFIKKSGIFVKIGDGISFVIEKIVGGFIALRDGFLTGWNKIDLGSGKMIDIWSIFSEMGPEMSFLETVGLGLSTVFAGLANTFTFVRNKVIRVIDAFRSVNKEGETINDLMGSMKEKQGFIAKLPYAIIIVARTIKEKFDEFKQNAPEVIDKAKEGFTNLKETIDPVITAIGNFVSSLGSKSIQTFIDIFTAGTTLIKNNSDKISTTFDGLKEKVKGALKFVKEKGPGAIKYLGDCIGAFVSGDGVNKLLDFAGRLVKLDIGYQFARLLKSMTLFNKRLSALMAKLNHPFKKNNGIKTTFQRISEIMLEVAASIGIITASLVIIGNMPQEKVDKGIYAIIDIFTMYTILGMVMSKSRRGLNVGGKGLIKMAIAIDILAMGIKRLANGVKDEKMLRVATNSISMLLGIVMIFIERMNLMATRNTMGKNFDNTVLALGSTVKTVAAGLLTMASAMTALYIPIKLFSKLYANDELFPGLIIAIGMIGTIGIFMYLISRWSKTTTITDTVAAKLGKDYPMVRGMDGAVLTRSGSNILGTNADSITALSKAVYRISAGLIVLSAAMTAMYIPVKLLVKLGQENSPGSLIFAGAIIGAFMTSIVAIMGIIAAITYKLRESPKDELQGQNDYKVIKRLAASFASIAGGLALLAGAITMMYWPVKLFGTLATSQPKVFRKGAIFVGLVMGFASGIVVALAFASRAIENEWVPETIKRIVKTIGIISIAATALVSLAGVALVLASAVSTVARVPNIRTAGLSMAVIFMGMLAVIGAIGVATVKVANNLKEMKLIEAIGFMGALSASFLSLAVSIGIIAEALSKVDGIPGSTALLIPIILAASAALAGLLVILDRFPGTQKGMLTFAVLMTSIGASLYLAAKAFEIITKEITNFSDKARKNVPKVLQTIRDNLGKIASIIVDSGALIGGALVIALVEVLGLLAAQAALFGKMAAAIVTGLCAGLAGEATVLVGGIVDLLIKALDALTVTLNDHGSKLVQSLLATVAALIGAIISGIDAFFDGWTMDVDIPKEIGNDIGSNIADGIYEGVEEKVGNNKLRKFIETLINGELPNEDAPAKESVGKNIVNKVLPFGLGYLFTTGKMPSPKNLFGSIKGRISELKSWWDGLKMMKEADKVIPGALGQTIYNLVGQLSFNAGTADLLNTTIDRTLGTGKHYDDEFLKKYDEYYTAYINELDAAQEAGNKLVTFAEWAKTTNLDGASEWYNNWQNEITITGPKDVSNMQKQLANREIIYKQYEQYLLDAEQYGEKAAKHMAAYTSLVSSGAYNIFGDDEFEKNALIWIQNNSKNGELLASTIRQNKSLVAHYRDGVEITVNETTGLSSAMDKLTSKYGILKDKFSTLSALKDALFGGDTTQLVEKLKEIIPAGFQDKISNVARELGLGDFGVGDFSMFIENFSTNYAQKEIDSDYKYKYNGEELTFDEWLEKDIKGKKHDPNSQIKDKDGNVIEEYYIKPLERKAETYTSLAVALGQQQQKAKESRQQVEQKLAAINRENYEQDKKTLKLLEVTAEEAGKVNLKMRDDNTKALIYGDEDLSGKGINESQESKQDQIKDTKTLTHKEKMQSLVNDLGEIVDVYATGVEAQEERIRNVRAGYRSDTAAFVKDVTEGTSELKTAAEESFLQSTDIGENFDGGVVEGIKDGWGDIKDCVHELTSIKGPLIGTFREDLGIHSPSLVMKDQASYIIDGLVEGLRENIPGAEKETETIFGKIRKSIETLVGQIETLLSGDTVISPKVSPVVDMTNIKQADAEIASMFSRDYTIKLASDVNKVITDIQNGRQEIINAINGINTKLDQLPHLTNNYSIEGVNVSEGTDVAEAVEYITDTALRLRRV